MLDYFERFSGRLMVFFGNLSPLFLITFIIYFGTPEELLTVAITVLSIVSLGYWKHILGARYSPKIKYNIKELSVKNAYDPTSAIIGYFLTYTVSLPSVAIVGGIRGLIVLLVLLVVIYLVFYENRIAFFNPLLSLFSYKMYQIETESSEIGHKYNGYLIVKIEGTDSKPYGKILAAQIDDFMFISRKIKKNGDSN
jgi:hypothetical protein